MHEGALTASRPTRHRRPLDLRDQPLGGGLLGKAVELERQTLPAPAQLAREDVADALRRPALHGWLGVGQLACGEQAEARASQQHVADAAGLLLACRLGDLGEQVGQAGDDRLRQLAAVGGEREHVVGGVAVAGGERRIGLGGHALHARQLLHGDRLTERNLVRPARRVAGVALDQPINGHLGHPPPCGELAAGDGDHPRGGLIQLGLARDVHRLLGVAGGDQGPHAGERAGQLGGPEGRPEEAVDGGQEVVHVLGGGLDVIERALVVVVGGAHQRVPQPRQREDRAPAGGGDDGAADER